MHFTLRQETPSDYARVERLIREAFWNVYRPGCDEHFIVHIMRGDSAVETSLNLVAEGDDALLGHIFWTHTQIITEARESLPTLAFGPISVRPDVQRQGIGSALIRTTLNMARGFEARGVVITGNPAYYSRFGFCPASDFGIADEEGRAYPELMALPLYEDGLSGVSGRHYFCPQFADIVAEALDAFDRQFEPREKLKLPGQLV